MGCAARWKTISGFDSSNAFLRALKLRTSPIIEEIFTSICAKSKREGIVGGAKEYPVTHAPAFARILQSQEPLKPVCPVIKTLFPR